MIVPIDDIGALRRAWQLYPDRAGPNESAERLPGIGEVCDVAFPVR